MRKLYQRLQNVLGFSRRETNGFLLMALLMLLAIAALFWVPALLPETPYDPTADRRQLDSLVAQLDTSTARPVFVSDKKSGFKFKPRTDIRLFPFNPNEINSEQWQQLGLPRFLAERIMRYRGKGGSFKTKSDLRRIYDFPEPLYQQLHPYIQLPETIERNSSVLSKIENPASGGNAQNARSFENPPFRPRETKIVRFDLNTADTNQLMAVRGIGPALSRRIVKYRNALGGFGRADQVREVYGLDSLVVDELLKYAYVNETSSANNIKKLRINTATVEELDAHPYISPRLAKVLVAYRKQHGSYRSVADVAQVKIMDEATLGKIAPYLSFE
ncbi:MAG: helix-hairpin-helix domain-containing protein [Cytophagales bacterium]|jgi:competence ComEA-like helix-hairpin-helix protein|nr:helix-hairpin-helix domain-containing protein [Cytophagales bacterium]